MLVIRLFRTGKKNQPFFKIVVTDKRRPPRGGRFVEQVGFLNPITKKKNLKADRIKHWLSKGAKTSDTVYNLLIKEKIIEGKKVALHKGGSRAEALLPSKKKKEEAKVESKGGSEAEALLPPKPEKAEKPVEDKEVKQDEKQAEIKKEEAEKPAESVGARDTNQNQL